MWWIILIVWTCIGTIFGAGIIAEEDMPRFYKKCIANLIIGPAWGVALILVMLSAVPPSFGPLFDSINNWLAKE